MFHSLRADFTIRCEGEPIYKFRIGSPSQRIVKSARRLNVSLQSGFQHIQKGVSPFPRVPRVWLHAIFQHIQTGVSPRPTFGRTTCSWLASPLIDEGMNLESQQWNPVKPSREDSFQKSLLRLKLDLFQATYEHYVYATFIKSLSVVTSERLIYKMFHGMAKEPQASVANHYLKGGLSAARNLRLKTKSFSYQIVQGIHHVKLQTGLWTLKILVKKSKSSLKLTTLQKLYFYK